MSSPSIVWFRKDLRVSDNPALHAAVVRGEPILCLFILDLQTEGALPVGGAAAWWLHHSLSRLSDAIAKLGGQFVLRSGNPQDILPSVAEEISAGAVLWNRCYEPQAIARDKELKSALTESGIEATSFNGSLLREPWEVRTKAGGPYGVFTPFWKAECALGDPDSPLPAPTSLKNSVHTVEGDALEAWNLLPTQPDWAFEFKESWEPGEAGARTRLTDFLDAIVQSYSETRNIPAVHGTSRLSPHLAFGELSPREIWHLSLDEARRSPAKEKGIWSFLREIGWRDFNHNLLFNNPDIPVTNYNAKFNAFPWQENTQAFTAWCRGNTGYPMVDAGMRELWRTGFMHNRVRMVVASFLVKHLLIDWRAGEAWFRDTLLDADLANNTTNWQWVAGCGADAAPYFRIFNPIGQGGKFDPEGEYVRHWVPEIASLPNKYLMKPWEAPDDLLRQAGIVLGETYPHPLVDHATARIRALAAYEEVKGAA